MFIHSYVLVIFILLLNFPTTAQDTLDSLKRSYQSGLNGKANAEALINTLKQIGREHEATYEFDTALFYYQLRIKLVKDSIDSEKIADSLLIDTFMDIAYMSINHQENETGLLYIDSAITGSRKYPNPKRLSKALSNKAIMLTNTSQLKEAISYLIEAREVAASIENEEDRSVNSQSILINIGRNYLMLEDWKQALSYTKKAMKINSGHARNKAIGHLNISAVYLEMENGDSALVYSKRAREAARKIENDFLYLNATINVGSAYEKLGRFKESLEYSSEALSLARKLNAPGSIAIALGSRGNVFGKLGQYDQALTSLHEALDLAELYDDKGFMKDFCESLSEVYARMNNYDEAYKYYTRFDVLNDSIRSQENQQTVNDLLIQYETAQKEQQIAQQELELAQRAAAIQTRNFQIAGLTGGLVILVLFGLVFYNQYRNKQQHKLQAAILAEKERGFESVIQATEEERNRISKDLHDGIGQQLSALKMALTNINSKITDDQQQEDLELITEQFSKSADEVRQISHQMMPRRLMEEGLVEAVSDLLKSSFQFSEVRYTFEHHKIDQRFTERVEISLYRVLQELVNNIIKHSGASEVAVQLIKNKDKLLLFVEDNGKGMNGNGSSGHGLTNIKSRLDMVKGSVHYEPGPGSGTSATISVPIT